MSLQPALPGRPGLSTSAAGFLFAATIVAAVAETQLTQYVQSTLGYKQPFFLFYLVHSTFSIIFPIHLVFLLTTTEYTALSLLRGIRTAITTHLTPKATSTSQTFPTTKLVTLITFLTVGVTLPALLWFAAISRAPVTDITAMWNTNAFFAYLFSVRIFHLQWERRKLGAVLLATGGVLAVVYGGATAHEESLSSKSVQAPSGTRPTAPAVGIILTLMAAILVALYQVMYKKHAALPFDPEGESAITEGYAQLNPTEAIEAALHEHGEPLKDDRMGVYPPPFGLFSNMFTSTIGVATISVLWILIPLLHWFGLETFRAPPDLATTLGILGIALTGLVFNAGWMVLLGIWGPIVVSVGNLLQIILMPVSDALFGGSAAVITVWSLVGSGVIVAAFCILVYDMLRPA